ncbi:MAG: zinc ribbon domain-containing protein [Phycisphaerae bacterium]|nr:zinc ribbon domain-containing protein [Phycisphaerae bacterium]
MEKQLQKTTKCPYCKEEIMQDAIKCKYCQSIIVPETPTHGGKCPFCKEDIKPDAIKCKHCLSSLLPTALGPLNFRGIGTSPGGRVTVRYMPIHISEACSPCRDGLRFCVRILRIDPLTMIILEQWTEKCRPAEFPEEISEVYH